MSSSLNLLLILNLLGATQALLLACALFSTRRGNRTANHLLATFTAVIAISIGGVSLSKTPYILSLPHLRMIHQPFYFLGAPLLFLYIRALILRKSSFEKRDLLHFIPFGLCIIYLMPFYLQSAADKAVLDPAYGVSWFRLRSALLILQFLIYLILIIQMLVGYLRKGKQQGREAEKTILFQSKFLLITFLALWAIGVLHYAASLLSTTYYNTPEADLIIPLGITAFIYALAYLGLRRPEILTVAGDQQHARRYETSRLTPQMAERYIEKLLHCMEIEKPFVDGNLTLQKLAKKLSISPQHLSQAINERLNQNFADFINTYRVEEAKKRLVAPARKHYTILAIAEEVGFNSKSSFNLVFKKHTNMTPSEFRKVAQSKQ